ncbi:P-loop containing nucleoside triphosphate hydrolase protein [Polychaeton citri CBS 116435]|uniref:Kinesin-like protein n=1 Tax=Polychaeton citri CBS 116435 TaxID=1314669 RepID=A0A9P4QEW7_9PEZI|nr:P-loop containing nucleoside triphosphate hydrolase protein [Polychaeton citri CBS 116435]
MTMTNPQTSLFDVYLRLRPSSAYDRERFLDVERPDESSVPTHITIKPPADDKRKRAVERFAFTRVFEESAGQRQVFDGSRILPLVEGVLGARGREGRDGLLATLGVTGSGKSHTILGSRSQRGLTQLTLDLLFRHTSPFLADVDASPTIFSSLCQADVSESQLFSAATFLDNIYGDSTAPSRAGTPAFIALVFQRCEDTWTSLSLSGYERPHNTHIHLNQGSGTLSGADMSMLSTQTSSNRRGRPSMAKLAQFPRIDDIDLNLDETAEYTVVVSMYEVYNDRIYDLLAFSSASGAAKAPQKRRALLFKPTEKSQDRKVVAGLRKVVCSSVEEAILVLETGLHERRVAGTGSNAVSSRSHGFFCVEVKKRIRSSVPTPWSSSTLTIVDLAGSERARTAKTAGATLAEAGKINESLMYLGQCMQMQSDNAHAIAGAREALVPYRQCKLTELLFSNSFSAQDHHRRAPQKGVMIVTADPLGDFNATSQILRYSALAREVTVPRIPSVTSQIGNLPGNRVASGGRNSPTNVQLQSDLDEALTEISRLRDELEASQFRLEEEENRRREVENSWKATELRIEEVEAAVREELYEEMESRLQLEMRRWRAARDAELDAQDAHIDAKLDIFARSGNFEVYEDEENNDPHLAGMPSQKLHHAAIAAGVTRAEDLEDENEKLREKIAMLEREKDVQKSPSKKMRVLKPRKWEGSDIGLDGTP